MCEIMKKIFNVGLVLCVWNALSYALPSCDAPLGGNMDNDTVSVGTWYLLDCFTAKDVKCTEKNCLKFEVTTPEERKQLSATFGPRLKDVKWDAVILKIITPCPTSTDLVTATPNYLEKTAPGNFKLISLPPVGAKTTSRITKPRPIKLELLKHSVLAMLDCTDLEPVLMVQGPPPKGYQDDPVIAKLLQYHAE